MRIPGLDRWRQTLDLRPGGSAAPSRTLASGGKRRTAKRSRYVLLGGLLGSIVTLAAQELRRSRAVVASIVPPDPETEAPPTETQPPSRRTRHVQRLAGAVGGLILLAAGAATAAYASGWHGNWGFGGDGAPSQCHHGDGGWQCPTTSDAATVVTTGETTQSSEPSTATSETAPSTTGTTPTAPTTTTTTASGYPVWSRRHHHDRRPAPTTTVATTTAATTTAATTTLATTTAATSTAATTTVATTTVGTTTVEPPTTSAPTTTVTTPTASPWHTGITSTVFWIGEPVGNGSSEDNSISAYDDDWEQHYGGYDDYTVTRVPPTYANGLGFMPLQNPFYLDLPYDDINNRTAFADRCQVVPWASEYPSSACRNQSFSYMKNHWVEIQHTVNGVTYSAYAQIEDAGPYVYDDEAYVFGTALPQSKLANNAGLDVSPAVRDFLHFGGTSPEDQLDNDENKVNWRFVDATEVPGGPWTLVVTTQQVYQP